MNSLTTLPWNDAMNRALALAHMAQVGGDVPIGAVILDSQGAVVGEGCNRREVAGDPLAHAEIVALRQVHERRLDPPSSATPEESRAPSVRPAGWNLSGLTLVVTMEPCPMCAGAAVLSHVDRIVFGSWDPKLGACGSVWDIPRDPHMGHSPEIVGGVRERECSALLTEFFQAKRVHYVDKTRP
ncbi:MAG: nucleoside deaminase [Bifidobacterium sp.]|uniref:tRNA-specific adenosine deaminase n=2 Tax=Bifidobacterium TaxID=1678 RepID=A0AB39ULU0_9BIFI